MSSPNVSPNREIHIPLGEEVAAPAAIFALGCVGVRLRIQQFSNPAVPGPAVRLFTAGHVGTRFDDDGLHITTDYTRETLSRQVDGEWRPSSQHKREGPSIVQVTFQNYRRYPAFLEQVNVQGSNVELEIQGRDSRHRSRSRLEIERLRFDTTGKKSALTLGLMTVGLADVHMDQVDHEGQGRLNIEDIDITREPNVTLHGTHLGVGAFSTQHHVAFLPRMQPECTSDCRAGFQKLSQRL